MVGPLEPVPESETFFKFKTEESIFCFIIHTKNVFEERKKKLILTELFFILL